ncbi:MAG TPA: hypothetical protein PK186_05815 [candidate division Zixibacteria bacterium]|nr:hypothetical protein [candidate division Zixibacteria bacterium]MDD4918600.1 hypothetical protein [candidate division Zixibacteria bacterium]MDM7974317.1 hypothetical protein [candidate division Zixibacteria bacterium]HPM37057.1 hypothetical protein [candidate division Zixibacteria bacterium]
MIRAIFSVFLVAVILWVSYLKVSREHDKQQLAYAAGRQEVGKELATSRQEAESLRTAMGEKELAFGETLMTRDAVYQKLVDSLGGTIDTLSTALEKTRAQLKSSRTTAAKPKSSGAGAAAEGASAQKSSQHERILAYYNQKFQSLPKDLSTYEQKVALAEIREETARKFSISLAELNRIRAEHKLEY